MRARWPLALLLALPLLVACGSGETAAPGTPTLDAPGATADADDLMERLGNPRMAHLTEQGPDVWKARFQTTQGNFTIQVNREWAPVGADRFYNLVKNGYFDGVTFFRVVSDFMAQFGIHGDPRIARRWLEATLQDDPVKQSNTRGRISYAMAGPNTRSVQVFINYADCNKGLDAQGFAPFGEVIEGMDVVDSLYSGYGNSTTNRQGEIAMQGDAFLQANYPELDKIVTAQVVD